MKNYIFIVLFFPIALFAQKKKPVSTPKQYQLKVNLLGYTSGKAYLAHYYLTSANLVIVDSGMVNKASQVVFAGNKKLEQGIYIIGFPNRGGIIDFLVNENQVFEFTVKTQKQPFELEFKNSVINTDYNSYLKFTSSKGLVIDSLKKLLPSIKTNKDSTLVIKQIESAGNSIGKFRTDYTLKKPNTMLSVLFNALRSPEIPAGNLHPNGVYDSAYARGYYISRYFDGVDFGDDRLLRTPFWENKLDYFFKNIAIEADTAFKYVDYILQFSKHNEVAFNYYINKFTKLYYEPQYMGLEKVFLKLYEKYYQNKEYAWLSAQNKKLIMERAYTTMLNTVGDFAFNVNLIDTLNKPIRLYDIKAEYTVLCFWDATCGHCRDKTPVLDSLFQTKWKNKNVALAGILVNNEVASWKQFITEKKFLGWYHLYQNEAIKAQDKANGVNDIRTIFDAYTTPRIFLLDKDKRIVARALEPLQADTLIQYKMYGAIKD
jgi:peroxiredoxin